MKSFFKIGFLFFIFVLLNGCETDGLGVPKNITKKPIATDYPWSGLNKEQVIDKYFKGKKLGYPEGIYLSSDNKYEVAIIKNNTDILQNYDYIAFLLDENAYMWRAGEIKFRLKETATPTILSGDYFMGNKSRIGRTFFFKKGYFEVTLPTGAYGLGQTSIWLKTHPKTSTVSNTKSSKNKKGPASGSAFFVNNNGYLITNYHVISSCNKNSKIMYNNKEYAAKIIAKDKYLDLALLKADLKNDNYLYVTNRQPNKLNRIIAAGYPFGKFLSDDLKFTSGIISSIKGLDDDTTRIQIDAALNPGNSGGPVVYETSGELAGVAVSILRKDVTEGVNFAIKSAHVKVFLESNQVEPGPKLRASDIAKLLEDSTVYTFCK